MAQTDAKTPPTLVLARTFRAPRERVFRAWTDPAEVKRWFHPPGYETPSVEIDLRVGGRYRVGMRKLPDGEVAYLSGTYREVRPPERLVYTWKWEAEPELGDTLVTVEFRDRRGSTEVVLTHERFPTERARDEHERGWGGGLDNLAKIL